MRSKAWKRTLCAALVLGLAGWISVLAQDATPTHFRGVINDYSPVSGNTTAWELHGPWSLTLNKETGKAHFSTALTMGLSAVGQTSSALQNITLAQHTHSITMDGMITYNPTDCPPAAAGTPGYTARIEVKGTASVFANGNVPPFGQFSGLQVCISGGVLEPNVPFSNVTLVFADGAAGHFGMQAIHGVVRRATDSADSDRRGRIE